MSNLDDERTDAEVSRRINSAPFMTYKEECEALREQVEKLTKERDDLLGYKKYWKEWLTLQSGDARQIAERAEYADALEQQLAALAEQNEKLKAERSSVWMVATRVFMMLFATKEDADQSQSQQGASTYTVPMEVPVFGAQLPDLASPVLNRIRAEGMRMAAEICSEKHSLSAAEEGIRARAAELEKTNG